MIEERDRGVPQSVLTVTRAGVGPCPDRYGRNRSGFWPIKPAWAGRPCYDAPHAAQDEAHNAPTEREGRPTAGGGGGVAGVWLGLCPECRKACPGVPRQRRYPHPHTRALHRQKSRPGRSGEERPAAWSLRPVHGLLPSRLTHAVCRGATSAASACPRPAGLRLRVPPAVRFPRLRPRRVVSKKALAPPPPAYGRHEPALDRSANHCASDAAKRLPSPSAYGGRQAARTATGTNTRELGAMIENPNRRDVLTKGSALIVASGAMLSASPGKTQEGSTEPRFVRFDHARALYIPNSDSPPFGLYATVFPRINPEELFDNSREVKLHDGPAVGMVEFTPPKTVGYILLASSQGEGGVNPELLHEQISSGFLEKSEELLHFFAVPPTGIPLADYMEGARINYKIVEYMDRHEGVFFVESSRSTLDRSTLMLSPAVLSDSECQCPIGVWVENFMLRNLSKHPELREVLLRKVFPWVREVIPQVYE